MPEDGLLQRLKAARSALDEFTRQVPVGVAQSVGRSAQGVTNLVGADETSEELKAFWDRFAERNAPTSTAGMVGNLVGNLVGEGGQYVLGGGLLKGAVAGAARGIPMLRGASKALQSGKVLTDAAAGAPMDIVTSAVGPENSTLGALAELTRPGRTVPAQARPPFEDAAKEQAFQAWWADKAAKYGLDPNPDNPLHQYDYRRAFDAQATAEVIPEDGLPHWPSEFKMKGHPNLVVDGRLTPTGEPAEGGRLHRTLAGLAQNPITRTAGEIAVGMGADVALRGLGRGLKRVDDATGNVGAGEGGALVNPARLSGQVDTGMPGTWFSRLQRAVEAGPGRATGAEWGRYLDPAKRGFAEMEAEWTGLRSFLSENADTKLTKDDVLGRARDRGIALDEKTLGTRIPLKAQGLNTEQLLEESQRLERRAQQFQRQGDLVTADQYFREAEDYTRWAEDRELGGESTRFEKYTQPGGENYREVLVKLDTPEPAMPTPEAAHVVYQTDEGWRVRAMHPEYQAIGYPDEWGRIFDTEEGARREVAQARPLRNSVRGFTSSHWPDDPNTLVHLRLSDRTINGEKTLFVEEIQSDWHQKGREQGYTQRALDAGDMDARRTEVRGVESWIVDNKRTGDTIGTYVGMSREDAIARAVREAAQQTDVAAARVGVPDAPYKSTDEWVGLAVRRVLQEAVKGGYDRIAWASGEQSAALYDLRKQVGRIDYNPDTQTLTAWDPDGLEKLIEKRVPPAELPDHIGKEPARRLLESPNVAGATNEEVDRLWNAWQDRRWWALHRRYRDRAADQRVNAAEAAYRKAASRKGAGGHSIEGDDLAVGGEGMLEFYDRIVPKVFQKEAKALGLKVDVEPVAVTGTVAELPKGYRSRFVDGWYQIIDTQRGEVVGRGTSEASAFQNAILENAHFSLVSRREVPNGPPAFRQGPPEPTNLSIRITPDLSAKIRSEGTRLGAADPALVGGIARAGIGASIGAGLDEENRLRGALIGGAAGVGAPAFARKLKGMGEGGFAVTPRPSKNISVPPSGTVSGSSGLPGAPEVVSLSPGRVLSDQFRASADVRLFEGKLNHPKYGWVTEEKVAQLDAEEKALAELRDAQKGVTLPLRDVEGPFDSRRAAQEWLDAEAGPDVTIQKRGKKYYLVAPDDDFDPRLASADAYHGEANVFRADAPPVTDRNLTAIELDDGTIVYDGTAGLHVQVAQNLGIPLERVTDGGFITPEGKYVRSSAGAGPAGEQARAAARVEEKRAARLGATDQVVAGQPFKYARNPERAPEMGGRFQQDIEPRGRYVVKADQAPEGWESGEMMFRNPLVLPWGKGYDDSSWKVALSKRYGGKTGEDLSRAIAEDGYDGIVTMDKYGTSEIVDLSEFMPRLAPVVAPVVEAPKKLKGMGEGGFAVMPGKAAGDVAAPFAGGGFAVTQEAISTGRNAFMRAMGDATPETRERFTREFRSVLTADDGSDMTLSMARTIKPDLPDFQVEVVPGRGMSAGDVNPNEVVVFRGLEQYPKEVQDEVVTTYMSINGILRGQDAQGALRWNPEGGTRGFVVKGPDGAPLAPGQVDEVLVALEQQKLGATVMGDGKLIVVVDYDGSAGDRLEQALALLDERGLGTYSGAFDTHFREGTRAYIQTLGGGPGALEQLGRVLTEKVRPLYQRYAGELGLGDEAFAGLDARVRELGVLRAEVENPPPRGNTSGSTVVEAHTVAKQRFKPIRARLEKSIVQELTSRARTLMDEFLADANIPEDVASEWYRLGADRSLNLGSLAAPELRNDTDRKLFLIMSSILSNGQQVPFETRQAMNIFEQFQRTGQFSALSPESAEYVTYPVQHGTAVQGQRAMRGERGRGVPTLDGPERIGSSHMGLTHELGLGTLNALLEKYGKEGTIKILTSTVPVKIRGGYRQDPVLTTLFGEKIGQYAADKIGIFGEDAATIDLWMARIYHLMRGEDLKWSEAIATQKDVDAGRAEMVGEAFQKVDDTVSPEMRRRMNAVMSNLAKERGVPMSTIQAELWYAIKNAYRRAGGKEKPGAYATLPSSMADFMTKPSPEFDSPDIGMGFPDKSRLRGEPMQKWNASGSLVDVLKRLGEDPDEFIKSLSLPMFAGRLRGSN